MASEHLEQEVVESAQAPGSDASEASAEATDALMEMLAEQHKQLSFSFAKRHQVLLETAHEPATLYHTEQTEFSVFAEVRRFLGAEFVLAEIPEEQFESLLTDAFQRDSNAARQLMEDIGNESDLFTLADELPDTEDLLESEDDAPIIRLINAMLGEAIRKGLQISILRPSRPS